MKYCQGFVTNSSSGSYTTFSRFELNHIELDRAKSLFSKYVSEYYSDEEECSDGEVVIRFDEGAGEEIEVCLTEYVETYDKERDDRIAVNLFKVNKSESEWETSVNVSYSEVLERYRLYVMQQELAEADEEDYQDIKEMHYSTNFFSQDLILSDDFIDWINATYELNLSLSQLSGYEDESFMGRGESMEGVVNDFYNAFESSLHPVLFSVFSETEMDEYIEGTSKLTSYEAGKLVSYTLGDFEERLTHVIENIIEQGDVDCSQLTNDEKLLHHLNQASVPPHMMTFLQQSNDVIVLFVDSFEYKSRFTNILIYVLEEEDIREFENTEDFVSYLMVVPALVDYLDLD